MPVVLVSVFIGLFLLIYFLKCDIIRLLIVPIGVMGAVVTARWVFLQNQMEDHSFIENMFLISIPLVFMIFWNEKLYDSLISGNIAMKNIFTYCIFMKIGLFLLSGILYSMGRLIF